MADSQTVGETVKPNDGHYCLPSKVVNSVDSKIVIFIEGCDIEYGKLLQKILNKKEYLAKIVFSLAEDNVTHYIVDNTLQFGTTKGFRYYSAITKGLWILRREWLWDLLEQTKLPPEDGYKCLSFGRLKMPTANNGGILRGVGILYVYELIFEDYKFNINQLEELATSSGARTFKLSMNDMNRCKDFQNLDELFFVVTSLGTHGNFCTSWFNKRGILTVHPEVVLSAIENNQPIDKSLAFPNENHRNNLAEQENTIL